MDRTSLSNFSKTQIAAAGCGGACVLSGLSVICLFAGLKLTGIPSGRGLKAIQGTLIASSTVFGVAAGILFRKSILDGREEALSTSSDDSLPSGTTESQTSAAEHETSSKSREAAKSQEESDTSTQSQGSKELSQSSHSRSASSSVDSPVGKKEWDTTPLTDAIAAKETDKACKLVAKGRAAGSAFEVSSDRWMFPPPLHAAADEGLEDVCMALLDAGVDVNATASNGRTPIHEAIGSGHIQLAHTLLDRGATPGILDQEGESPLHWVLTLLESKPETVALAERLISEAPLNPAEDRAKIWKALEMNNDEAEWTDWLTKKGISLQQSVL